MYMYILTNKCIYIYSLLAIPYCPFLYTYVLIRKLAKRLTLMTRPKKEAPAMRTPQKALSVSSQT